MTARHRGFFTPDEDDEVRRIFLAYRNYRIALSDTINNYRDFEQIYSSLGNVDNLLQLRKAAGCFAAASADPHFEATMHDRDLSWLLWRSGSSLNAYRQSHVKIFAGHVRGEFRALQSKAVKPFEVGFYRLRSWVIETFGNTWLTFGDPPAIPAEHIEKFRDVMEPGDVFIVRPEQKDSTVFLPDWWTHSGIDFGSRRALEDLGIADRPRVSRAWEQAEGSAYRQRICCDRSPGCRHRLQSDGANAARRSCRRLAAAPFGHAAL